VHSFQQIFKLINFTRSEQVWFPSNKIRSGPYLDNPSLDLHFDDEDTQLNMPKSTINIEKTKYIEKYSV
jgi:hypothetical protein